MSFSGFPSPALIAGEITPDEGLRRYEHTRGTLVALQEELDWSCYRLYGLTDTPDLEADTDKVPTVPPGERAFELLLAQQVADGDEGDEWFTRHRITPRTDIPTHWPEDYQRLVARRLEAIASNPALALIERPECKRRWSHDPFADQLRDAARRWLEDRLEDARYWPRDRRPALTTAAQLADVAARDARFREVAEIFRGRPDFDVFVLVEELVASESVPALASCRYHASGLRKREAWEHTWELQRQEDALDARTRLPEGHPQRLTAEDAKERKRADVGDIPVPPKYDRTDFLRPEFWPLRGKLDMPKERFVSYPFARAGADTSLVITWAGYDHLQQAQALAQFYLDRKEHEGLDAPQLVPLLAALLELLPWLLQWHDAVDAATGERLGTYFSGFLDQELHTLGITRDDAKAWQPAVKQRAAKARSGPRGRRAAAPKQDES